MIALDASAILAFMLEEPGQDRVRAAISDSCISTVNLAEVTSRFSRDGLAAQGIIRHISAAGIEIVPFDQEQSGIAGDLTPITRARGLSLGDRACLALATTRRLSVLTADRAWQDLDLDIEVQLIR